MFKLDGLDIALTKSCQYLCSKTSSLEFHIKAIGIGSKCATGSVWQNDRDDIYATQVTDHMVPLLQRARR